MPGRSTQQNLTNFEAISLRLELLAVVNAKLLFGNIKSGRSALSLTTALRQNWPSGEVGLDRLSQVNAS
jgi:hypothetical protein